MKPHKKYVLSYKEIEKVNSARRDYFKKFTPFIIKEGKIKKNGVVVDVPCGTGVLAKELSKKLNKGKIILIDINPVMIKAAKRTVKYKKSVFIVGDAGDIGKLIKEKVDTIICTNGFELYIHRKRDFLRGCKKILRPNGKLIFDIVTLGLHDRYSRNYSKLEEEYIKKYVKKFGVKVKLPSRPDNKKFNDYKRMIKGVGFRIDKIKEFTAWLTPEENLDKITKVPGRSRPWLEGLSFSQRVKAFRNSNKAILNKFGRKNLEHNRLFFVLSRP